MILLYNSFFKHIKLIFIVIYFLFHYHFHSHFSLDETLGDYYYFNFETGETQWNHPLDKIFREKVIEARRVHSNEGGSLQEKNNQEILPKNSNSATLEGVGTENLDNIDVSHRNEENLNSNSNQEDDQEMSLTPKKLVSI